MKTGLALPGGGEFGESPLQLELLLAYEDRPTAERAKLAVARVLSQPAVNTQPKLHPWRLDVLGVPKLGEQAEKEAATADILVISLHGKDRMTTEAEGCLTRWIGLKREKPCSLVISLDLAAKALVDKNPSLTQLRSVASRNGIPVLLQFADPIHWSDPYPHWGINE
jgi:hypothetical protein